MGTLAGGPGHRACMACMCMKVIVAWYARMHAMLCNAMEYRTLPLFDGMQCVVYVTIVSVVTAQNVLTCGARIQ